MRIAEERKQQVEAGSPEARYLAAPFAKRGSFGVIRESETEGEMKRYWSLAVFACGCLSAAAVWMGALNQDEGWYLYAANLVSEGMMPYRDFSYTQGPLMPVVYSAFCGIWKSFGLLGARVMTLVIGWTSVVFACATASRLAPEGRKGAAALVTAFLLACNLYHVYYMTIPKTYALASLFVSAGFFLLAKDLRRHEPSGPVRFSLLFAGLALAFAAGTRVSLGAILCVVGCWFLFRREWKNLIWFCVGGFLGLGLVYGPFVLDADAFSGLIAAQKYHAARGGFDLTFTVGSLSRFVRWYLPVFIVLGLGLGTRLVRRAVVSGANNADPTSVAPSTKHQAPGTKLLFFAFLAVFVVQMLAPFPYEDYQVPIMGLLAVFAAVLLFSRVSTSDADSGSLLFSPVLLVFGLAYACAFGSPLLQEWTINGQDRFWSVKKAKSELAQLREVAETIEALDPGGETLLTQDLYLAIETGRKVPRGLEMGPFSMLTDEQWKRLLGECDCEIAALSGYTFAVDPPRCDERPIDKQMEYWNILKRRYEFVVREDHFGQNATPLLILKRK